MTNPYEGHPPYDPTQPIGPHNCVAPYIVRGTDYHAFPGNAAALLADARYRYITPQEWGYIRAHGLEAWQNLMRSSMTGETPAWQHPMTAPATPSVDPELTGTVIAPAHVLATAGIQPTIDAALGRIPADQPGVVKYADGRDDAKVGEPTPPPAVSLNDLLAGVDLMSAAELDAAVAEHGLSLKANASEAARKAALKQSVSRRYAEAAEASASQAAA